MIHRGRPGCDEGGARPIIRTERYEAEDGTARVRIFLPTERSRWFPDGESATTAKVGQLIALAPPYWPFSETRTITEADVRAARAHVGERAVC